MCVCVCVCVDICIHSCMNMHACVSYENTWIYMCAQTYDGIGTTASTRRRHQHGDGTSHTQGPVCEATPRARGRTPGRHAGDPVGEGESPGACLVNSWMRQESNGTLELHG